jgi:hypothetical protein
MDHVVYVDAKSNDLQRLLDGSKRMVVRGANGRRLPYGIVSAGDWLYFVQNRGDGLVRARAKVMSASNSAKLTESESVQLIQANQPDLQLTHAQSERVMGRRYIVLVALEGVESLQAFPIDRGAYGNMDDWLPVKDINRVRIPQTIAE